MTYMVNGLFSGTILPTTTLAGCIDVFEGAWPNPQETIELIEKERQNPDSGLQWAKAFTINNGVVNQKQTHRTNYDLGVTHQAEQGNVLMQSIHNQMYLLLLAALAPYCAKHDIGNLWHENYNLLRYSGGQEYKAHFDGGTETKRAVSAIIYLNDNYEGGEVEFVNFNVKIKPKPGLLLLFPSNYAFTHIAHPVTSGTKYALVTWLHDRP